MPLNAWKNSLRSESRSRPVTRFSTLIAIELPAADDPGRDARRLHEHLHAAALDELRQPLRGVEEVERVARGRSVEDEEVVAALLVDLEELLHRHVLLRAGQGVGELAVDAVLEDPVAGLRVRGVLARRARRRSPSRRASSPRARRASRRRRRSKSFGSTCLGVFPSSSRPSESARRLAGSIVSTHTFCPRAARPGGQRGRGGRLAHAARAGADADPVPLDDLVDRRHQTSAPASRSQRGDVELRLEDEGQGLDRR